MLFFFNKWIHDFRHCGIPSLAILNIQISNLKKKFSSSDHITESEEGETNMDQDGPCSAEEGCRGGGQTDEDRTEPAPKLKWCWW